MCAHGGASRWIGAPHRTSRDESTTLRPTGGTGAARVMGGGSPSIACLCLPFASSPLPSRTALRNALALLPGDATAYNNLAWFLAQSGRGAEASRPSPSVVMQKGQALATVVAPVSMSCSVRFTFTRLVFCSSIHI